MTQPPTKRELRGEARTLLARLNGSTRRDRVAFVYGFVLAVHAVADHLPPREYFHLHGLAQALHDICGEDYR